MSASTWRERGLNAGVSVITACVVVFLTFGLNRGAVKDDKINQELKTKAPYEYVDKQDAAIQEELKTQKAEHDQDITDIKNLIGDQNEYLRLILKDRLNRNK